MLLVNMLDHLSVEVDMSRYLIEIVVYRKEISG